MQIISMSNMGTISMKQGLALEAGRLMKALASSASSLSKTGEPRPLGQARITHVTSPPQESPRVRTSSMAACTTHGVRVMCARWLAWEGAEACPSKRPNVIIRAAFDWQVMGARSQDERVQKPAHQNF